MYHSSFHIMWTKAYMRSWMVSCITIYSPPKDISSWTWRIGKGPWKDSHNFGLICPHILSKLSCWIPPKEIGKKKDVLFVWNKKVNKLHMKTKCPKQPGHLLGKKNHRYAPCFEIKLHSKNVWQSPKNPLAHLKCVSHLWPRCNP